MHLDVLKRRLANNVHLEADAAQLLGVKNEAAIKEESRLVHARKDAFIVERLELVPLGANDKSVGLLGGLVGILVSRKELECCACTRGQEQATGSL